MSLFKRKNNICFITIILPAFILAQNNQYVFRHLTTENGLANDMACSFIQDKKGFIWIATDNGLQKYDGYTFETYHHDPLNPRTINSDRLRILLADADEKIWAGTYGFGFNLFDTKTHEAISQTFLNETSSLEFANTYGAIRSSQGDIWFRSIDSPIIIVYNPLNKNIKSLSRDLHGLGIRTIKNICSDQATGNIWIGTSEGLFYFNSKTGEFFSGLHNPEKLPVLNIKGPIYNIFTDRENDLWVSMANTPNDLWIYNRELRTLKKYPVNINQKDGLIHKKKKNFYAVDCMVEDKNGEIWMGSSGNGLLQYDKSSDSFRIIIPDNTNPEGLHSGQLIQALYEDREGNIWIGTDRGVNVFNPSHQKFYDVKNTSSEHLFQGNAVVNFFQFPDGKIWTASYGGGVIEYTDRFAFNKTLIDNRHKIKRRAQSPWELQYVWSLIKVKTKIWAGCQHGYLIIYDTSGHSKILRPPALDKKTIKNMTLDRTNHVWLTLQTAIACCRADENKFTLYNNFIPFKGKKTTIVADILIDSANSIWVATEELGLQKFNAGKGTFSEQYVPQINISHSISSNAVNCFISINDSILAVGTGGGGINLFNKNTKQFQYITTAKGLPSNFITALYFEAPDDLWVTTNNGLCKYDMKGGQVINYGPEDGITEKDFSAAVHFYKTQDEKLLVGTNNGFIYFDPKKLEERNLPPDVQITGFHVFDKSYDIEQYPELKHTDNFINIQYASLSFLSPGRLSYFYKLEGVDKKWVPAGSQRIAKYTDLRAGKYLFLVKCCNRNGIWSLHTTAFGFTILHPYWNTWWFYLLCALAVTYIFYFLYRIKINQWKIKHDIRNRISSDLHDDIGSTLSSINIYSEVAASNLRAENLKEILTRITESSADVMENMNNIVWAINPGNDDLESIMVRLKVFAAQILEPKGITVSFTVDWTGRSGQLGMEKRRDLLMIFKEAINNIAKYSKATTATILVNNYQNQLRIWIQDDGTGFDKSKITYGNGLKNIEERVRLMEGQLLIQSSPGQGTRIEIKVRS